MTEPNDEDRCKKLGEFWGRNGYERQAIADEVAALVAAVRAAERAKVAYECGWCGYEQVGPDGMNEHALTCEKGPTAKLLALVQQMIDADAIADWFMDVDADGVDVRGVLAAILEGKS